MRTLGPFELSDWAQTKMPEESLKVMKSMCVQLSWALLRSSSGLTCYMCKCTCMLLVESCLP